MGYYGLKLPPYKSIRVRCSASVNPEVIAKILIEGKEDYVIVAGCPPKNCHHHLYGNYIESGRMKLLNEILREFGLENRVRFEYIGVAMWG